MVQIGTKIKQARIIYGSVGVCEYALLCMSVLIFNQVHRLQSNVSFYKYTYKYKKEFASYYRYYILQMNIIQMSVYLCFSALPGGNRNNSDGSFNNLGNNGYWWSSTENDASSAWYRYLHYDDARVYRNNYGKRGGFSVRCLRD